MPGDSTPSLRPRGRVVGQFVWICANCGHFNRTRLHPLTFRFKCKSSDCRRTFSIGFTLYMHDECERGGARCIVPSDYDLPYLAFTEFVPGAPAHSIASAL